MPPHFHAKWAKYEAIILICISSAQSSVYAGNLAKSQLDLVLRCPNRIVRSLLITGNLPEKGNH